jgi:cobalamin biosynthesis protein CobT
MDFEKATGEEIGKEIRDLSTAADYMIFTRDFDKITVFQHSSLPSVAEAAVIRLDEDTRHMVGVMQKDIERMMAARSQVLRIPGYRSGRLHTPSLHRVVAGEDRVFARKFENRSNDVAVGLLIDCSGSMSGAKFQTAMVAAYALASVLERVKVKCEAMGFTTDGWGFAKIPGVTREMLIAEETMLGRPFSRFEPIYMPIFKGFDERLSPQVKQRFACAPLSSFLANNIDGECVEIASNRLLKRRETRKVLIVLSDGAPAAYGDPRAQSRRLKEAVVELERRKVETIGIGIMTGVVRDYYPKHIVLKSASELPTTVMRQLRSILV